MQGHACGTRDRNEIAMRVPRPERPVEKAGRIRWSPDHRPSPHPCARKAIGYGHAHAFQRAYGIGIKHENVLQRRAWSMTESSRRSNRSRLSAMASFTSESLRMRSACAANRYRDRYADGADGGKRKIEHAPFVTGGGEDVTASPV